MHIHIDSQKQILYFYENNQLQKEFLISTGKNGMGEEAGSEKTPRGLHVIRARIGAGCLENTVFKGRRPTGEIYNADLHAEFSHRDWILTRILWLSGKEKGKNRLGANDTMRRYIYIHGTPDSTKLGSPGSRGCVRMANKDILYVFDKVTCGVEVYIE